MVVLFKLLLGNEQTTKKLGAVFYTKAYVCRYDFERKKSESILNTKSYVCNYGCDIIKLLLGNKQRTKKNWSCFIH
jgi:hypothetical protein